MADVFEPLVDRIIAANEQIPAAGCRAQHATHGGHYRATFVVHGLGHDDARLAQGLFAAPREYPAVVRYSNGKERDESEDDVHGMAIKVLADAGERLLIDPDNAGAVDFVLIDVDWFFSRDLADYATINENLAPILRKKQNEDNGVSFGDAVGVILKAFVAPSTIDDLARLAQFKGDVNPVEPTKRWHLKYSSSTPYKLGDAGPVKYHVRLAAEQPTGEGLVTVEFCVERPRDGAFVDVEDSTKPWNDTEVVPVATLCMDTSGGAPGSDIERLRFNPWHVPPEHEPLGAINRARRRVYDTLADRRQSETLAR
ncbi:MAG: hypothetical protein ACT4OK_19765 [Gemmobacter sp.]